MQQNLDALKQEIDQHLQAHDFAVFYGLSRLLDGVPTVHWDCARFPDFRQFLEVAERVGAKVVVYHQRIFVPEHIDEALLRLEDAEMSREEHRAIERRLRDLRMHEGFLCALELSFDYEDRLYLFDLRTAWYEELSDLLDEIDANTPDDEDDEPEPGPLGGYFSKN